MLLTDQQKQDINNCIVEYAGMDDTLTESSNLKDDIGLDSLDVVEVTMKLESMFDVTVDSAVEYIETIGDLYKCIENALDKKGEAE